MCCPLDLVMILDMTRWLSLEQSADYVGRTPKAMRQLRQRDIERARQGKPKVGPRFRKVAGRVVVSSDDLDRWLTGDADPYEAVSA